MTVKDSERKLLYGVLQEVRPYTLEIQSVERIIERHLESANSIPEFIKQLESESANANSNILRTDLRIYVARLRRRTKD